MSVILGKRVPFSENVSSSEERGLFLSLSMENGYFPVLQVSVFLKKGSFFPSVNISERGNSLI